MNQLPFGSPPIKHFFEELDALLRGRRTARSELAAGDIRFALPLSLQAVLLLGGVYGVCMGLFSLTGARSDAWLQIVASAVKLPALFLLTLLVTSPSLYVFSALAGSHLRFWPVIRLLMATLVVTVAVGASLAPILAFFTLSSTSYAFMVILNVLLLGASGLVGVGFLRSALLGLMATASTPDVDPAGVPLVGRAEASPAEGAELPREPAAYRAAPASPQGEPARRAEPARRHAVGLRIFRFWVVAYAMVGAQTGWLLRPFIGSPEAPFTWFRAREGSFFLAVLSHLHGLFQ